MLPTKKEGKPKRETGLLARTVNRFRDQEGKVATGRARIGFLIDATGSREHTWAQAQKIQARMFLSVSRTGTMALRLVHFGGYELVDHGWQTNADKITAAMAQMSCVVGRTQIVDALERFAKDTAGSQAESIILIGDAFEEDIERAYEIANVLADKNIKVFTFLEGDISDAEDAFRIFARVTGGKFARFGDDLPLADLCEGVALLTAGGKDAVKKITNRKVKRLLLGAPSGTSKG